MAHALKRHRRRYFTCESVGHHRAGLRLAKKNRLIEPLLLMKSTGCVSNQRCLETGIRVMCTSCLPGRECFVLAKSNFDPPFTGSFEIVERLVPVASRLDLPVEASRMHSTCHVPNLMACVAESDLRTKGMKQVCEVCVFGREAPSSSSSISLIITIIKVFFTIKVRIRKSVAQLG
ncbi:hypothetical protein OSB04_002429 [Centaurea solstitialis]|uniref:Tf2-1-like SH3-like domain-containing protein n=1 Tax=Centaurea solstitialis TaxID=347529 RepID=A0AA38U0H8_9ASTR|nr:hypothetical protein OSB04_002429 [Centaurea solstitialis]